MSPLVPNVFSIAGSDPSGGAGIQADLKTFAALGVFGCAAITALTAQSTVGVSGVLAVPADFLRAQLEAVFTDIDIAAVKIGMLGDADTVHVVAEALRRHQPPFVVLDPVFRASTGAVLLDPTALEVLWKELLPLVSLVTPNAFEAGALLGIGAPCSAADAAAAAERIVARGVRAALVTGGHLDQQAVCIDVLHDGNGAAEFRVPRVDAAGTHGTGCVLSAAIAAHAAKGMSLHAACASAQCVAAESVARSGELRVGHGVGPAHPLGALWARAESAPRWTGALAR